MMQSTAMIYTTLFLIIGSLSVILGVNILLAGPKVRENRLFFAVSLLLGLWAFGFSAALAAPNAGQCLVWRRVAAFGWSMLFAVVVHFALAITGHGKLLGRPWVYGLIYLPALLCAWVFSLYGPMAQEQYHLVSVGGLWVNEQVNNGWDYFFYGYLFCSVTISMALFWRMWRKSPEEGRRQQGLAMMASLGAAVLLGSVTDLVNSTFWLLPIPQMAPVAFLIPNIAVNRSIRKYSLMVQPEDNDLEIILNDQTRARMLRFLSVGLLCGSAVYFATQHLIDGLPLADVLPFTGLLFASGIAVLLLQRLNTKNRSLQNLLIGAAVVSIPTITLSFVRYASITVWAFPFIFIVLSMLFNNRRLLVGTSVTALLTQAIVWIHAPDMEVTVNASDYLARLGIFAMVIWIALYVNKVYVRRLKENADKNRYQKLISDISAQMVTINAENRQEKMRLAMMQAAECLSAAAAFLCLINTEGDGNADVAVWQGGVTRNHLVPDETANQVLIGILSAGPVTGGSEFAQLPQWAAFQAENGAKSVLSHPILLSGVCVGFLGLAHKEESRLLTDQYETVKVVSNIFADFMARLSAEREIAFMAYHDPLTTLPNRLLFTDRTEQAIYLAKRSASLVAVIFLDLDSFKSVNDSLGHRIGDDLIREVAHELSGHVRKSDTVSRFGGDEFLIMLNNMDSRSDITSVMRKIMGLFDRPFHLHGHEIIITASAGIAVYPQDGENTDLLVKNADIAMYRAKELGKNQFLFCSEDMKEETRFKARLTNDLYRALDRGEFRVFYQPQVALEDRRIVGAEALLRWVHPEYGVVPPSVFIPLAEKTGLIGAIGDWVLRLACRQASAWQAAGLPRIRIAVNISANQLRNPLFAELVKRLLAEENLDPECLELEVTEGVAIREPAHFIWLLNQLKQVGVQLSIDDFGTEYSSLSRLKLLPADRIKIDMQFVQGIDKNSKDRAITKGIINLAKSLRINVIAEGVENDAQLAFLEQDQCDEVQGYYFYRPMPAEDLEKVLRQMGTPALDLAEETTA